MAHEYSGDNRREFFRCDHESPVRYRMVDEKDASGLTEAISRNLSASGILFSTKDIPKLSSLLVLDLDYKTANVCREIEDTALIIKNRLFGKVVRIEDNNSGAYDVGVAFIRKFDKLAESIKKNAFA